MEFGYSSQVQSASVQLKDTHLCILRDEASVASLCARVETFTLEAGLGKTAMITVSDVEVTSRSELEHLLQQLAQHQHFTIFVHIHATTAAPDLFGISQRISKILPLETQPPVSVSALSPSSSVHVALRSSNSIACERVPFTLPSWLHLPANIPTLSFQILHDASALATVNATVVCPHGSPECAAAISATASRDEIKHIVELLKVLFRQQMSMRPILRIAGVYFNGQSKFSHCLFHCDW